MSQQPLVTVLMSVFNDAAFLPAAVESILSQSFPDFEFLVIDDGSTDGSKEFLGEIQDARVRIVRNSKNLGLTRSLKLGVELAQGKYIARMDADDISLPKRLEKQVKFLEENPDIGILGSAFSTINSQGRHQGLYRMPLADFEIRWRSLFLNPFAHPSVMLRRDVLEQNHLNYDEKFVTAQDYDLWARMLNYTQGANLAEPLLKYRIREGITTTKRQSQLTNHNLIAKRIIEEELGVTNLSPEQIDQLRVFLVWESDFIVPLYNKRVKLCELCLDLLAKFTHKYPEKSEVKTLERQEASKLLLRILRPPLPPGWIRVVKHLFKMEPSLQVLLGDTADILGRKLKRSACSVL